MLKKLTFLTILALAPPLLLLSAWELGLRMAGYGYSTRFWVQQTIDEVDYYLPNPNFTRLFFPEGMKRLFYPFRLHVEKPVHEFRIFVLGGSAINGDPHPDFSVPRMLEKQLNHTIPERNFVVVNAALTACNSFVAREISKDLSRFEPDLVIIYMGNNEVVGPFGPANQISAGALGNRLPPLQILLRKSKLVQWLQNFTASRDTDPETWRGMQHFLDLEMPENAPALNSVYRSFENNLYHIIHNAQNSGAHVLLSTVAVNLKDQPPFLKGSEDFSQAEHLLRQSNNQAASKHFALARDYDRLRFRADSNINNIIRAAIESFSSKKIHLVDIERKLNYPNTPHITGFEYFYEHVHFNFNGGYNISQIMAENIRQHYFPEATGHWLETEQLQQLLAFTDYDIWWILKDLMARFDQAPFTFIEDYAQRIQWMRDLYQHYSQQVSQAATKSEVNRRMVNAIQASPDDNALKKRFAKFLAENEYAGHALPILQEQAHENPMDLNNIHILINTALQQKNYELANQYLPHLQKWLPQHPRIEEYRQQIRQALNP